MDCQSEQTHDHRARKHRDMIRLWDGRVLVFVGMQVVQDASIFLWVSDDGLTVHWQPRKQTQERAVGYVTARYIDRRPSLADLGLVCAAFFRDDTPVMVVRSDAETLGVMESATGWPAAVLVARLVQGDDPRLTPSA